jgi:hypothetical protein
MPDQKEGQGGPIWRDAHAPTLMCTLSTPTCTRTQDLAHPLDVRTQHALGTIDMHPFFHCACMFKLFLPSLFLFA